jgi:hypothetical protein
VTGGMRACRPHGSPAQAARVETGFGDGATGLPALLPQPALQILAAWAAVGLCLVGLGALVRTLLGRRPVGADDRLGDFWLGWATAIALLQAWQLAWPVDRRIAAILAVLGAVGLVVARPSPATLARGVRRHAVAVLAFLGVTTWLALQALGGPRNGDSGLYHVPTIAWHLAHRLPPGLGNLAAPFAYNQSYFLWVALLDVAPLAGRGSHVANALFVVALAGRVLLAISRVLRARPCGPADLFYAFLLPAVLPLALDINLTSPSPDVAVFTLGVVIAGETLAFFARGRRFADLAALALLVALAPTLKLSLAGLAAATGLVAAAAWLRRPGGRDVGLARAASIVATIALLVPGGWMLRGVVLSGYPLYPSSLLGLSADWAVPHETVVAEAKLIRYWNGVEGWWWIAWQDPAWIVRWLPTLDWLRLDVLVPLGIVAVAAVAAIVLAGARRGLPGVAPALIVLPTIGSLLFCIANAPRARYGASAYWVLAAQTTCVALPAVALAAAHAWVRRVLVAVAVGLAVFFLATGPPLLPGLRDFEPQVRPHVVARRLPTGLVVNDPGDTMQCWNAELPCTPFDNDTLRLRHDGDLASGFTVRPAR